MIFRILYFLWEQQQTRIYKLNKRKQPNNISVFFSDFFRGPVISNIRLAGIEHVISITAIDGKILFRNFKYGIVIQLNLSKLNLCGTNLCVPNKQVFGLYRLNLQKIHTLGLYLLYPPQRSCRRVCWFHHVCPSVDKSYVVR